MTYFKKCSFNDIKEFYLQDYNSFSSPIDTFAELKILDSNHYKIFSDEEFIGYTAIINGNTVTLFSLFDKYKNKTQEVFAAVKKMEYVSKALVATCNEYFLSAALDHFTRIEKQAYFFKYKHPGQIENNLNINYKPATTEDINLINENCDIDDFFDDKLEEQVRGKEVYIGTINEKVAAFGILERSKISEKYASIGMFTHKDYRNRGIGKITLSYMIEECQKHQMEPVSGCWYFNHFSKKTLESVGMVSETRYLNITFN